MNYSRNRIDVAMMQETFKTDNWALHPLADARHRGGVAIWVLLLIVVGGISFGGWLTYRSFSKPSASSLSAQSLATHRVTRGSFDMVVIANGEIEAKQKVEIKNKALDNI